MSSTKSYKLSSEFEKSVIRFLILDRYFWSAIGEGVNPDLFSTPVSRLAARAAVAIAKETGNSPGSFTIVIQRLVSWREAGQISHEQVLAADDYLQDVESMEDVSPVEQVVKEFLQPVQRALYDEALRIGFMKLTHREDFSEVIKHMETTRRLGEARALKEASLNSASLRESCDRLKAETLSTGIQELDNELDGGPPRVSLNVVMAPSGGGKSMMLTHLAASALLHLKNVCYATLELSLDTCLQRLFANLTGIPMKSLKDGSLLDECEDRLGRLDLGQCRIAQFQSKVTEAADILNWVGTVDDRSAWSPDALFVDYADLLKHRKQSNYEGMAEVYGALRDGFAVKRNAWVWTASQSRRGKKDEPRQGIDDVADSINKVRISDTWLSLRLDKGVQELEVSVCKDRTGVGDGIVTLPTELECSRVAPVQGRGLNRTEDEGSDDLFD